MAIWPGEAPAASHQVRLTDHGRADELPGLVTNVGASILVSRTTLIRRGVVDRQARWYTAS
jgi:hypothetical protein